MRRFGCYGVNCGEITDIRVATVPDLALLAGCGKNNKLKGKKVTDGDVSNVLGASVEKNIAFAVHVR